MEINIFRNEEGIQTTIQNREKILDNIDTCLNLT